MCRRVNFAFLQDFLEHCSTYHHYYDNRTLIKFQYFNVNHIYRNFNLQAQQNSNFPNFQMQRQNFVNTQNFLLDTFPTKTISIFKSFCKSYNIQENVIHQKSITPYVIQHFLSRGKSHVCFPLRGAGGEGLHLQRWKANLLEILELLF